MKTFLTIIDSEVVSIFLKTFIKLFREDGCFARVVNYCQYEGLDSSFRLSFLANFWYEPSLANYIFL